MEDADRFNTASLGAGSKAKEDEGEQGGDPCSKCKASPQKREGRERRRNQNSYDQDQLIARSPALPQTTAPICFSERPSQQRHVCSHTRVTHSDVLTCTSVPTNSFPTSLVSDRTTAMCCVACFCLHCPTGLGCLREDWTILYGGVPFPVSAYRVR